MSDDLAGGPTQSTSLISLEDALARALEQLPPQPGVEIYDVSFRVERGGIVGRVQYHATLSSVVGNP